MSERDLEDRSIYAFWTDDTIRYSDLDPNYHVNNGAIGKFFEDGRVRFRNEHLAPVEAEVLRGFVLVRYVIEYHAQLRFPGRVDIGTGVMRIGRSSYTLAQGVFEADRCIASAEVVTVRLDPETGRSGPIPEALRSALEAWSLR